MDEQAYNFSVADLKKLSDVKTEELPALVEGHGGYEGILIKLASSMDELPGEIKDLERRRKVFGENFIGPKKSKRLMHLLWEAFLDPLLLIINGVAVIAVCLHIRVLYGGGREEAGEAIGLH